MMNDLQFLFDKIYRIGDYGLFNIFQITDSSTISDHSILKILSITMILKELPSNQSEADILLDKIVPELEHIVPLTPMGTFIFENGAILASKEMNYDKDTNSAVITVSLTIHKIKE